MNTLEESPELAEHLAGASNREIGDRLGVSHEQARRIVIAQSRELVNDLGGRLLLSRRDGQVVPVCVIPDVSGDGFRLALRWVDWLTGELGQLNVTCRIHIEPVPGGFAVGLTEDCPKGA